MVHSVSPGSKREDLRANKSQKTKELKEYEHHTQPTPVSVQTWHRWAHPECQGLFPTQPYAQTLLLASKQAQEPSKTLSGNYLDIKAHILFWQQGLGRLSPLLS